MASVWLFAVTAEALDRAILQCARSRRKDQERVRKAIGRHRRRMRELREAARATSSTFLHFGPDGVTEVKP